MYHLVGEEKRTKTQIIVQTFLWKVESNSPLDYKYFFGGWGFLIYVFDTYSNYRPFLKGVHITLDYWQTQRDSEGWKQEPGNGL